MLKCVEFFRWFFFPLDEARRDGRLRRLANPLRNIAQSTTPSVSFSVVDSLVEWATERVADEQ